MHEKVVLFLCELGIPSAIGDSILSFVAESVTAAIKQETNCLEIPEGMMSAAIYRSAGQYMKLKKESGQMKEFDLDAVVKQIQEGDTSIGFAIGAGTLTPEQRLDSLIDYLMNSGDDQFAAYRRLKW